MLRRNREIVIFNLSAIDLFCSGMGAVMVLMVLLMPYYRKQDPAPRPVPLVQAPPPPPVPEPPKPVTPEPEKGVKLLSTDVVFVMDATASMQLELQAVQSGMGSIVQVLRRLSDDVRVGFVAYVDHGSPANVPLKSVSNNADGDENLRELLKGIDNVQMEGGDDWPEDVCDGLEQAIRMNWPTPAADRRQIIVLIGDARTHPEDRSRSLAAVAAWAKVSPIRSVNAVHAGELDPRVSAEYYAAQQYFKEVADAGHGEFFEGQENLLGSILDILIVR